MKYRETMFKTFQFPVNKIQEIKIYWSLEFETLQHNGHIRKKRNFNKY